MGFSNIIALFIVLTTAATLNAHGIKDIQTSSQAAEALRPIAGEFAFVVFALGIIGTGMLAVPVLAGSAAYAVGEALALAGRAGAEARARQGVLRRHRRGDVGRRGAQLQPARSDQGAVLERRDQWRGGGADHDHDHALSSRRAVMGQFTPGALASRAFGWLATAVMAAAAIGMFATWGD